jgi:hypothetical protein
MSASPLTLLPAHSGVNLAPLKPLLKLGEGEKNTSDSFEAAVKERFLHYHGLKKETWEEAIAAGEEVANFISGKQFLMPNPFAGGRAWIPYTVKGKGAENERRALSIMQYHTSGNLEKWLNSNPDIIVRPGVESDDAHEAAEAAKIIVDHYENKFYEARITQAECLEGLTFGSYIWRLRVDPTLKSVTAYRQIFENREVRIGKGWGKCGDCPKEGSADEFEDRGEGIYGCPSCGGEAMVIPQAKDEVPHLVDREKVELGDFRLDLIPFPQCRWDLKYHADESPWLIIRRKTTMAALRQILGNVKLPEGEMSDPGLDALDRLAYAGQARAGHSASNQRKTAYKDAATVDEWWASSAEYGDIILQRDAETVSGQVIRANIPLGEQFGDKRVCFLGLNGMSTLLGVYDEDHQDYVVQGKWYAKANSGAGRGLQDLTEVQKVQNSDHQKIHTFLRGSSTPAMLVASEVLGEEGKSRYIATPGENIPVPLSKLAEGLKLNDLVAPAFVPTGVHPQFFEFTYNRLGEFAQFASHFLPFTSGMPGVDNKTATGANITQAATNALYTPVLSVKGEIRKLVAEKLIKLYPKHFPVERYFPLGGKHSQHSGKYLSGANLNTDLVFEVVTDSWLPRNSYTRRQDYISVIQMFGGVLGWLEARKADPVRTADIERAFDLEVESEAKNVAESLCFRRVRQMQQAANLINDPLMLVGVQQGTQLDPATGQPVPTAQLVITGQGAIQPPVSQAEPAHAIKRQWLMEWLDSDDGLDAPAHVRQAVEVLVMLHTQLDMQQASLLAGQAGAVQLAGQQPQMQAQQEMQAAQGQQEVAQREQEMGLQAAEAIGGQALAESELQTEAAREGIKNESAKERAEIKAAEREHALAVRQEQEAMKG